MNGPDLRSTKDDRSRHRRDRHCCRRYGGRGLSRRVRVERKGLSHRPGQGGAQHGEQSLMSDSINGAIGDAKDEVIVGIDLGTTNSEVAAFVDGQVRILGSGGKEILPSVVGISPSGELLVGEVARNQLVLYPERTVRSIKRKMGSNETVSLGDREVTPAEISALILRQLGAWAS